MTNNFPHQTCQTCPYFCRRSLGENRHVLRCDLDYRERIRLRMDCGDLTPGNVEIARQYRAGILNLATVVLPPRPLPFVVVRDDDICPREQRPCSYLRWSSDREPRCYHRRGRGTGYVELRQRRPDLDVKDRFRDLEGWGAARVADLPSCPLIAPPADRKVWQYR